MKAEKQFAEIRDLILKARARAFQSVNRELINLYWEIGQYISGKVNSSEWGKKVVQNLADYLKLEEPGLKGFSNYNLWRMRRFYETYKKNEIVSAVLTELTWTNHLLILGKAKSDKEREFYIQLCIKEKYSSRELERQIDSGLFERNALTGEILSAVLTENQTPLNQVFRENYVLDFLSLPPSHSEKDLRMAIVRNLKKFVLEFGKDFSFLGEEYRIDVGSKDFYIDLLFYHRELQCLVAFDLKITDFKPEYLGKMNFYLEALDRDVKKKHEKPSVGIILCKNKDRQVVEYALNRNMSPAMVAQYETSLIDKFALEHLLDESFNLNEPNK